MHDASQCCVKRCRADMWMTDRIHWKWVSSDGVSSSRSGRGWEKKSKIREEIRQKETDACVSPDAAEWIPYLQIADIFESGVPKNSVRVQRGKGTVAPYIVARPSFPGVISMPALRRSASAACPRRITWWNHYRGTRSAATFSARFPSLPPRIYALSDSTSWLLYEL